MSARCYLNILFHMHQPYYRNPRDGAYLMPWVRLHALRNYTDMPALHERFEGVKVSYNLVPSLLEQILDYADGATDSFEVVSRQPAADLDEDQKRLLLSNFFQLNRRTQIDPMPRFRQLLEKKGSQDRTVGPKALERFDEADFRDLQVLFNLAWSGWLLREREPACGLLKKGGDYSEEEKLALLDAQRDFLGEVLDPYRRLAAFGMAELSSTPFYHPILPLLCDLRSAREAVRDLPLPGADFRRPDDAAWQIENGLAFSAEVLGKRPIGMWPSEGSVSAQACELMAQAGVRWAATDRSVLGNSLGREAGADDLYAPYVLKTPAGELSLFFRDTQLSDSLGFIYQNWQPERAAADFMFRIEQIASKYKGEGTPVVSVILDGENAWEYYPDHGRPFFEALYGALAECDWLSTVTPSEVLQLEDVKPRQLDRVVAGSWIYGTLTTWIGHAEKNRGWEMLAPAREALERAEASDSMEVEALEAARKEMMIAEGSDWFWWYGDDHSTAYSREFDALFREHVSAVYRHLGQEPPHVLSEPIKRIEVDDEIRQPVRFITPELEGRESRYFEWLNAGHYCASGGAGSMHQAAGLLEGIYFGFDLEAMYFRFDARIPFDAQPLNGRTLRITITCPLNASITYQIHDGKPPMYEREGHEPVELAFGAEQIIELALPWELVGDGDVFAFYVTLEEKGDELERHPRGRAIEVHRGGEDFEDINWSV